MATNAILVKRALKDKIDGLAALDTATVSYGPPHREPPKRFSMVGEVKWEEDAWVTNQRREEVFSVEVIIRVQVLGTPQEAEDALIVYTDAIEDALKADVKLGLTRVINSNWNPKSQNTYPIDEGSEAIMHANYRVKASK